MEQEERELYLRTEIINFTAPSVPCWAVFASEEGNDDAPEPDEFWAEAVHLWAQTRTAVAPDEVERRQFLGNEVPLPPPKIVGMVIESGYLTTVDESEFVFLGYSRDPIPNLKDWAERIRDGRQALRKKKGR